MTWCPRVVASVVVGFVFVALSCIEAAAFAISFDPASYTGRYRVHTGAFVTGPTTVELAPGTYSLETGAGVGGSSFLFTVDSTGNVTTASVAAVGTGSALRFRTTTIVVDPQLYSGRFLLSSHFPTPLTGLQSVVVLPGLVYGLDTGAVVGGSTFYFAVDGAGQVATTSGAAVGSGNTLRLRNTSVTIDPALYAGQYFITSHVPALFTGRQTFVLVPDLVYFVDNTSGVGGSAFQFRVDAAGQVSTTSTSAVGSGSTLTFRNVTVHVDIDPVTYAGLYLVGGYRSLSGPRDLVLIPDLTTVVATAGQAAAVTPTSTEVIPSPATFTVDGRPVTFSVTVRLFHTFQAFTAHAEIDRRRGEFEIRTAFTLAATSNGIDPRTEEVRLRVGTFVTVIPPGSFRLDHHGRFKFEGRIAGVALELVFRPLGTNRFEFKAEGERANLAGTENPVTIELTVGNDGGSTVVTAEFD